MATKKKDSEKTDKELLAELKVLRKEKRTLEAKNKELTPPVIMAQKNVEEYVDTDIRPDSYIQVISLCPHPLNLSTAKEGGKKFRFEEIGKSKRILYGDLVDIIEAMPTFAEKGVFYIADKRVVRRHGLDEHYDNILTKEEITSVMNSDSKSALKIFTSANRKQKDYLSEMLVQRIIDGENVDMNFVHLVSQDVGFDIAKKAEESKDFKEALIKK